ncbi:MAG: HD domain-containing protein, partial [Clostridia bacterium]|nr:HD domain-containing protein [Clostridia bacterium]
TVARALRLNEDLTEAIALGHDLGHTPFGHAGERALDEISEYRFTHYEQSARVCEFIEKDGKGLNLTGEVLDGIKCHTKGDWAKTLEGRVVRYCDRIAYINHDIADAIRGGIITGEDIPKEISDYLGNTKSARINKMVNSIVKNSDEDIKMDAETLKYYELLHEFLFESVYRNPVAKGEESKVKGIIEGLYNYFYTHPEKLKGEYAAILERDGVSRAVTDYIAGMTDHFAVETFKNIYIPRSWDI